MKSSLKTFQHSQGSCKPASLYLSDHSPLLPLLLSSTSPNCPPSIPVTSYWSSPGIYWGATGGHIASGWEPLLYSIHEGTKSFHSFISKKLKLLHFSSKCQSTCRSIHYRYYTAIKIQIQCHAKFSKSVFWGEALLATIRSCSGVLAWGPGVFKGELKTPAWNVWVPFLQTPKFS